MGEILRNHHTWANRQAIGMSPLKTKASEISEMKGMHSLLWTKGQVHDMPQYGTTGQAYDQILEGMQSPIAEGAQDSPDSCTSPKGRSPGSPSKVDKARDEFEELKDRQVQLMREKNKWKKGLEEMKAIFEKMKHSKDCLDETCCDIVKTKNWSEKLDNDDDFPILSAGQAGDQTGNKLSPAEHSCGRQHVKQGTQCSLDDNNVVGHDVQYNVISEQKSPRKNSLDDDCFDKTECCDKDSRCYTISPGGRYDDHALSDVSDDYSRSPPSDNSEHSFNGNCSPTQYTQHNEHSPTQYTQHNEHSPTHYTQHNAHSPTHYTQHNAHSPTHLTQHIEHFPATEHDVTNNNSKEEDSYLWLSEISPSQPSKSIQEIEDFLFNKDNNCQLPEMLPTQPSKGIEEVVDILNNKENNCQLAEMFPTQPSKGIEEVVDILNNKENNCQLAEMFPTQPSKGIEEVVDILNNKENNCQLTEMLPTQPSKGIEEVVDILNNKENNCQLTEMLPTQPSKGIEEVVDILNNKENNCQLTETRNNRNNKLTGKRPSSSQETPIPCRRRHLNRKEACLIKLPVANTEGAAASVLATVKEITIESDNSTELNPAREKLPVRELEKEGLLTDNKTNGEQLAKETKGDEASGKTGSNKKEKTQADEGRAAKECQPNDGNVESDSDVLNKRTVDTAKDDSSSKIEPTVTNRQQAGEHNTEATLNYVGSSIVLGKDNTSVENKVKANSVNTTYETMTENPREEEASNENIAKDGDLKSAQCPKEVPTALGTDASERTRVNDSSKRGEVQGSQPADASIFIDDNPQVEVSKVDENGEEGNSPNETRKLSNAPENAHEQVETDICSLEEGDLDTNSPNTCDSSNRTCSATKEVLKAVRDTTVKRALVDDDSESNCNFILERRTMHNSTPPSRRMKDLSTTDCYEERDIIIVETSKAEKNVAISFVQQNHPNKLSDAKDNEQNTEDVGCDDAKSDGNIRKRASRIDNKTEEHLKAEYNTKENDAVIDNSVAEIGITVNIVVNKSSMNTANTTSQQNRATADEDGPRIQTALYNTDWRGRLFFRYISLATLLCVMLATLLSYLNE